MAGAEPVFNSCLLCNPSGFQENQIRLSIWFSLLDGAGVALGIIPSLSLLPSSVSCVLVRLFSILSVFSSSLDSPLCWNCSFLYSFVLRIQLFNLFFLWKSLVQRNWRKRGEKNHKVTGGRKGKIIEMLESLYFCNWHLTEARAFLLYANGFVCIS